MKNQYRRTLIVAAVAAGATLVGCAVPTQNLAMPEVDTATVCDIQGRWNRMSPDEQTAALNYQVRRVQQTYSAADVDALRQRVRTQKC